MAERSPVITLLSDFGLTDPFVGMMKGVILSRTPQARLVDITHSVPPQDVATASFLLAASYPYFPPGTVHLAVVDPGVGTQRRPLAALINDHFFVAPDNGLLSHVLAGAQESQIVHLNRPQFFLPSISRTFHGRDLFAPVSASLAGGASLSALGTPVLDPVLLPVSRPAITPDRIEAHLIYCDHFGNLVSDLTEEMFAGWLPRANVAFRIQAGSVVLDRFCISYSEVAVGQPLAIFDSFGHLEIAIREGNACRQLGLKPGDPVEIRIERGAFP